MTYNAIVAEITNLREHPNADRLKLATVLGSQVVIGLEHYNGEKIIYFPTDGKLSEEYCTQNELYPIKDSSGTRIGGGFFEPGKERVRAQNFRGQKSDGFVATVDSLAYTGFDLSSLSIGAQFNELNGHKICEKYFSPATLKAMKGGTKKTRIENPMFPKHVNTDQWAYNKDQIQAGTVAYVTEKLHGTSGRYSYSLVEQPVKGIRGWLRKKLGKESPKEWQLLVGTRNVVLSDSSGTGFYGDDTFRYRVAEQLDGNLRKGEIIYGELVGWANENTPIMPKVSTKEVRKSDWFKEMFDGNPPDEIAYNYAMPKGECDFYVYRIAHSDPDGNIVELSWPQVKARCGELGLKTVPEIQFGTRLIGDFAEADMADLTNLMEFNLDRLSSIDPSHISEGVCVRLEQPDGTTRFMKNKSYGFKLLEGIVKADENYVDMEESS